MLFSCSIKDNIAYGADDPEAVTTEEIYTAAREANAYNFIQSFPQGFDTVVGEKGVLLSGQKATIANQKSGFVFTVTDVFSTRSQKSSGTTKPDWLTLPPQNMKVVGQISELAFLPASVWVLLLFCSLFLQFKNMQV